jgi:3'-phosphoadenosine 5'-phosphosulfate sulfotransferase (PAPS reductase)/FAD synthetase
MKRYLSFGGGVNSVALGLWLMDHGIEAEWVYADHGADWPETREYVQHLKERGLPITILDTGDIYQSYWNRRIIPMRPVRWCTTDFKVKPLNAYFQTPCIVYVGIDAGEAHRADKIKAGEREGETKEFPLVDEGMDRAACIAYIREHPINILVPPKSGCYFCPHQRVGQIRQLRTYHKDLFDKALALEMRANEGKEKHYYLMDRPLDVVAMDNQPDLFGERDMTPCLCQL